ncbi:MAG: PAP2 family protein, partial [Deltaproteobacteria bacterium]|nr:PAP2 family protein [Deltaproteobacteria bacterium]
MMIILPLFLLLTGIIFEYSGFDVWWVSHFFDEQTRSWPFRNHWLFKTVIHEWGRYFDMGAAGLWLVIFILSFFLDSLKSLKKLLVFFLVSSAAGPL